MILWWGHFITDLLGRPVNIFQDYDSATSENFYCFDCSPDLIDLASTFFFVPTSCIPILLVSIKFSNSYVNIYIREANIVKQNSDFVLTCLVCLCLSEENLPTCEEKFPTCLLFLLLTYLIIITKKKWGAWETASF